MMIDKTLRKATAERHGPVVVIHMTGGPDCLWLNMYLDCERGQMTCDSDIGFYAYHWGNRWDGEDFISFCIRWFYDDEWMLRKCIGERNVEKEFDRDASIESLRREFAEEHETDENETDSETFDSLCEFDDVLEIAAGYDNHYQFSAALCVEAEERGVELPDEWWGCIVEDYTPWQKRFAEICREVIVPELKRMMEDNDKICSVNGAQCNECIPGAPCEKWDGGGKR